MYIILLYISHCYIYYIVTYIEYKGIPSTNIVDMSPSNWKSIESLTGTLHSPVLVAKFQRYFGVDLLTSDPDEVKEWRSGKEVKSRQEVKEWRSGQEVKELKSRQEVNPNSQENMQDEVHSSDLSSGEDSKSNVFYVIRNKFWFYLFTFGAGLGYEVFYATFFPFWFWNIDGAVGRRMVLVWVIIMYIGQALKDVIRWPRPSSPPVVSLEPDYVMEYGMPSTHAMVGVSLPFSMLIFTVNRYEVSSPVSLIQTLIQT